MTAYVASTSLPSTRTPGKPKPERALVERDPRLALDRLGDRPLVVLAEEHDRGVVGGGEDERLVDVALRGRAVAEVGDHGGVAVGVAGADDAVALHAHGVAGGVQGLRADDDRVEAEVVLVGVPAALVDAAEQAEQLERVDAAAPGDAVLAVGREDVVLGAQRAAGADLRGLLAEQLGPDAELAVALERGGLGVDPAGQHHVAVEAADHLRLGLGGMPSSKEKSGCSTRSPSGVSSWMSSGPPSCCGGPKTSARSGPSRPPAVSLTCALLRVAGTTGSPLPPSADPREARAGMVRGPCRVR